ncbi:hypothetical protein P280DRAFT_51646 [Massarina eburnea CBS 473.64]|uniref:Uncharacterized protein n=1 Tax=Massarina eburnea CBS 473.64 TaxID=1395130 RepID=A0A6A6RYL7_9PLEO|nr:hypothetical protein P280DRAFT_51646 [Massarina eburnea CBS 473.64]
MDGHGRRKETVLIWVISGSGSAVHVWARVCGESSQLVSKSLTTLSRACARCMGNVGVSLCPPVNGASEKTWSEVIRNRDRR